jgi:hypothetical protein
LRSLTSDALSPIPTSSAVDRAEHGLAPISLLPSKGDAAGTFQISGTATAAEIRQGRDACDAVGRDNSEPTVSN